MTEPLLTVRDLKVEFQTGLETVHAVNGASLTVEAGEIVAVLGESGSGKSVTAAAIMRILPIPPARIAGGEIIFQGRNILTLSPSEWKQMLARDVALVLQDALSALNPVYPVGWQIAEVFRVHGERSRKVANAKAVELLKRVGIPDPERRAKEYPHQFSGGMRQRVMIAMAVALRPRLLIADEPTTALDVTVQADIMDMITQISWEEGMSVLLVTHDLGVALRYAQRVCVMYAGRVVEAGPVREVLSRPAHPYTLALLQSAPQARAEGERLNPISGSPPDLAHLPPGCPFHPRCRYAADVCRASRPAETNILPGRRVECHRAMEVLDVVAA
ncbi:ABC transporter ATP-binding protein [Nitratireductor aestuarii]|uniref:ABC transporter ATP-binding protein n=1 Tax=Nitratireductor aestuarii TaxID=1735103 RepID=A0A916RTK4_9HYPH|nr:ABC transporter ATP-binding protein [Nitratireductor aestuarii]GGA65619.1 ABC transporter ATP-binding protein [Nitratireductor aestuarii]